MEKKHNLIIGLGFEEVTQEVLKELESKTTKAARDVFEKATQTDLYRIYLNREAKLFTVHSSYLVTQKEVSQIKQVLKCDYKKVGTLVDENGLWAEWISIWRSK